MQALAKFFTHILIKNHIVAKEDEEIYFYGLQLILSSFLISICVLGIGLCMGKILLAVTYLIIMSNLRHYSGGYHAKSYYKCFGLSIGIFLICLGIAHLNHHYPIKFELMMIQCIAVLSIIRIGSLNSDKNPKTIQEMYFRKKMTRIICLIDYVVSIVTLVFMQKYIGVGIMIACVQISVALAMLTQIKLKEVSR